MIIIPSIDIKNAKCVRLTQGDFTKITHYSYLPAEAAEKFSKEGASVLHIVDLDGAKNEKISQINCIYSIRKVFKNIIQVGGGIRSDSEIEALLEIGVNRVVIGSSAVFDAETTNQWLEKYTPEVIVLALDFKIENNIPYLAVKGWQQQTKKTLWETLDLYPSIVHTLCTDIGKDGMQNGPNFKFYEEIKMKYPKLKVQASGGITSLQDLLKLKKLDIDGAIIGKALHENTLNLQGAIQCLKEE